MGFRTGVHTCGLVDPHAAAAAAAGMKVTVVYARGSAFVDGVVESLEASLRSGGHATSQFAVGDCLDLP